MEPTFMKYTHNQKENMLMEAIIVALQKLGGSANKKDLIQYIRETSVIIPEDFIDYYRTSMQTGKIYKPFTFHMNFALKHLLLAEYTYYPTPGHIELTEKGRNVQVENFDAESMVRSISDPIFKEKSKKRKLEKELKNCKLDSEIDHEEIASEVDEIDKIEIWRQELHNALMSMSPKRFELFCRKLVNKMGVDIDETIGVQYVADGGIDGFGYIQSDDFRTARVAIQAKRWVNNVPSPEIDKFRGAMDKFNAEFGIFITTSDFTKDAIKASREGTRVITLLNGEDVLDLVAKYELYVRPVTTYVLEDFYFEDNEMEN